MNAILINIVTAAAQNNLAQGVELMLYGLAGVFTTLILFIGMIYALMKLLPCRENKEEDNR